MPRDISRYLAAGMALLAAAAAGCGGGSAPPSTGSMVTLAQRWYGKADPAVCAEFTDELLKNGWGKAGEQGRQLCRKAVEKAKPVQLVTVGEPTVDGDTATVKVSYTQDGERRADELEFVLVGGRWLANRVTGGQVPAPPPATTTASTAAAQPPPSPATTAPQTSTGAPVTPVAQFFATLNPVGASGERGSAALRATLDGKTFVTVFMKRRRGGPQAVEIVRGTCASPGATLFWLPDVRAPSGVSSTTLAVPLGTFRKDGGAVVVHAGGAGSPITACGELSSR